MLVGLIASGNQFRERLFIEVVPVRTRLRLRGEGNTFSMCGLSKRRAVASRTFEDSLVYPVILLGMKILSNTAGRAGGRGGGGGDTNTTLITVPQVEA
jgi:hypothetical protein